MPVDRKLLLEAMAKRRAELAAFGKVVDVGARDEAARANRLLGERGVDTALERMKRGTGLEEPSSKIHR